MNIRIGCLLIAEVRVRSSYVAFLASFCKNLPNRRLEALPRPLEPVLSSHTSSQLSMSAKIRRQ